MTGFLEKRSTGQFSRLQQSFQHPLCIQDVHTIDFIFLKDLRQAKSKTRSLNFRKAKFQLLTELFNKTPWETVLRAKSAEQSFHRAQELSITRYKSQERKTRDQHG